MSIRYGYIVGENAVDIARITGLELETVRGYRVGEPIRYLDLDRLDAWDRFRVAWALVGAYAFLENSNAHAINSGSPTRTLPAAPDCAAVVR